MLETTVTGLMLGYSAALYEAASYPLSHLRESMEHGRSTALGSSRTGLEPVSLICYLCWLEPIT